MIRVLSLFAVAVLVCPHAGEAARKLEVAEAPKAAADPEMKCTGTGEVATEVLQVKGGPFECERISLDVRHANGTLDLNFVSRIWTSREMPFIYDFRSAGGYAPGIEWEGTPSEKGGLVRLEMEIRDMVNDGELVVRQVLSLVDYRFDAVPQLKTGEGK